jgi:hypothetical protein
MTDQPTAIKTLSIVAPFDAFSQVTFAFSIIGPKQASRKTAQKHHKTAQKNGHCFFSAHTHNVSASTMGCIGLAILLVLRG